MAEKRTHPLEPLFRNIVAHRVQTVVRPRLGPIEVSTDATAITILSDDPSVDRRVEYEAAVTFTFRTVLPETNAQHEVDVAARRFARELVNVLYGDVLDELRAIRVAAESAGALEAALRAARLTRKLTGLEVIENDSTSETN